MCAVLVQYVCVHVCVCAVCSLCVSGRLCMLSAFIPVVCVCMWNVCVCVFVRVHTLVCVCVCVCVCV